MTNPASRAEIVVDLDAIAANTAVLRKGVGRPLMAVVKADGYGHGLLPAARAVLAGGADMLGVAVLDEALALRAAGVTTSRSRSAPGGRSRRSWPRPGPPG
jgi:alanine racemase